MAPELSRLVRRVTFALLAVAAAVTEFAADEHRPALASLAVAAGWVGVAAVAAWLAPAPADGRAVPPTWGLGVLVLLAAAPFAAEPLRRGWLGEGYPLEIQMVLALRNLGLGLAALGGWLLCLRLACVVSLFLLLFAVSMTDHPGVLAALGLYSAGGSVWLMLVYWSGLRQYLVAADPAVTVETRREPLPWASAALFVALVGVVLAVVAAGPARAARVLGEWLPTSGGTGGYDPFARGGVNDGDDEVKGDNANSTGLTETDSFLDSPLPSLYDLFNDLLGEPFKPKDQERSIALDSQTKARETDRPPADNLRPNREFPTTRRSPKRPREAADRAARALFEVVGRTPVHLRVTAFDHFDGVAWHEAPVKTSTCRLEKERDSRWMVVQERTPQPLYAEEVVHQIKVTRSPGTLVPTPPHLARFRLGRVDQADFFSWGQDRIVRMADRKTPAGVTVETVCRVVDPGRLGAARFPEPSDGDRHRYHALPKRLHPDVRALAERWTAGIEPGWPRVKAVVEQLRDGYTLDPAARVPEGCDDPLRHFLIEAKRGPDYQFATAAAVLVRAAGCPTRLVSGFYAAPDAYDPLTRHTPVVEEDLHFWAEVQVSAGDWLLLEATPGYDMLGPSVPLTERLAALLLAGLAWAWAHAAELTLGTLSAALVWWRRRPLLDAAALRLWAWLPGRTWQVVLRRAVRLLECRGAWAGRPRRASQTVPNWLGSELPEADGGRLAAMAGWAAYGDATPPWDRDEVHAECRRVLAAWPLGRWEATRVKESER